MATKDAYLELGLMISNFYDVANIVDKKIDDLMLLVEETEQQHDQVLKALGQEINDLKRSQELLKKDFTETIIKFCATDESDYAYLILQDKETPETETKTVNEIFLVTKEIERLCEKEGVLKKERKELALRFCKSFPGEKGYAAKSDAHDNVNVPSSDAKTDQTKIDGKISNWHGPSEKKITRDFRTWSLTKVMTNMYGFTLDKAKKEEGVIRNLQAALCWASKKHRALTKNNFINEVLGKKKSKLKGLLEAIKLIKKSSEIDKEVREAKELIMDWLYQIEREIFFLVNDLHYVVSNSGNEVTESKFQEYFRSKLARLKRNKHGRVPVVVYRILALLEARKAGDKGRRIGRCKDENKKEILLKIDNVMSRVYKMILCLMSVLNANSTLPDSGVSMKEKLLEFAEIVERCDKEWRIIRMTTDEALGSIHIATW